MVQLSASNSSVTASPTGNYTDSNPLANVTVLGLESQPRALLFNNQSVGNTSWSYNSGTKALSITGLDSFTSKGAWNASWTLEWT